MQPLGLDKQVSAPYVFAADWNAASAEITLRVSPIAAASFAETRARRRLGMAMAAMMPMIATTISSSISVKPFSLFISQGSFGLARPAGGQGLQRTGPPGIGSKLLILLTFLRQAPWTRPTRSVRLPKIARRQEPACFWIR